jgi:hypothetical protein
MGEDILKMRQKYINATSNRANRAKELLRLMRAKEERIVSTQTTLVGYIRDLEMSIIEYQAVLVEIPGLAEIKGAEFDKLMIHPDIESVLIENGYIQVCTGPICIEFDKKVYDIGKFKIDLSINPNNFVVKMTNLTRSLYGTAHPHIYENGNPCLGNIAECLPQMVGRYQFAAAINICIQFLKNVNEDKGHYSKITDWPLKKAEEKRKDDKK